MLHLPQTSSCELWGRRTRDFFPSFPPLLPIHTLFRCFLPFFILSLTLLAGSLCLSFGYSLILWHNLDVLARRNVHVCVCNNRLRCLCAFLAQCFNTSFFFPYRGPCFTAFPFLYFYLLSTPLPWLLLLEGTWG